MAVKPETLRSDDMASAIYTSWAMAMPCHAILGTFMRCAFCKRWPKSLGAHCQCPSHMTVDTYDFGACGGCKAVLYCSRKCQEADWARHQSECQVLKEEIGLTRHEQKGKASQRGTEASEHGGSQELK